MSIGTEEPITGEGTKFYRHNGLIYEEILRVENISGPGMEKDLIDVTNMGSPAGYREFIAGFKNAGTVELTLQFTASGWAQFKEDYEARPGKFDYKIVLPDEAESSLCFTGIVMNCPLTVPFDNKATFNVSIQISGKVNFSGCESDSL